VIFFVGFFDAAGGGGGGGGGMTGILYRTPQRESLINQNFLIAQIRHAMPGKKNC